MNDSGKSANANTTNKNQHNKGGNGVGVGGIGGVVGGPLETAKAEKAIWLMKCPALVSNSLKTPPPDDPSRPVAKVVLSIDPLKSNDDEEDSSPLFTMEFTGAAKGDVPTCYFMDMSKDFVPMSVFSESSQGKMTVEGKIKHKFDMRPHGDNLDNYGKLCRERTNKYRTKNRQIKVITNDKGTHMRPMPGLFTSGFTANVDKKKPSAKSSDMKRTRRDKKEMEVIMFKLFEKQGNWTLKQLILETDQPEQFLKDMLKELCVYNNKGTNQGTYELKPEYKKSSDDPNPN